MLQGQPGFLSGLLFWLVLVLLTGTAGAAVRTPQMDELTDSADLIIIGEIESVRTTPPYLWRQIGMVLLLIAVATTLAILLWKRRFRIAAYLAVTSLLPISLLCPVGGIGGYRKVASVSVSSAIKGAPSASSIAVYYDNGFICDITHLTVGQEYLLFLKTLRSGYTTSWYDWSVWIIEGDYAQTERRVWHGNAPIAIRDLIGERRN